MVDTQDGPWAACPLPRQRESRQPGTVSRRRSSAALAPWPPRLWSRDDGGPDVRATASRHSRAPPCTRGSSRAGASPSADPPCRSRCVAAAMGRVSGARPAELPLARLVRPSISSRCGSRSGPCRRRAPATRLIIGVLVQPRRMSDVRGAARARCRSLSRIPLAVAHPARGCDQHRRVRWLVGRAGGGSVPAAGVLGRARSADHEVAIDPHCHPTLGAPGRGQLTQPGSAQLHRRQRRSPDRSAAGSALALPGRPHTAGSPAAGVAAVTARNRPTTSGCRRERGRSAWRPPPMAVNRAANTGGHPDFFSSLPERFPIRQSNSPCF